MPNLLLRRNTHLLLKRTIHFIRIHLCQSSQIEGKLPAKSCFDDKTKPKHYWLEQLQSACIKCFLVNFTSHTCVLLMSTCFCKISVGSKGLLLIVASSEVLFEHRKLHYLNLVIQAIWKALLHKLNYPLQLIQLGIPVIAIHKLKIKAWLCLFQQWSQTCAYHLKTIDSYMYNWWKKQLDATFEIL